MFRNEPVGCTGTIMYEIYKEKELEIAPNIAGLLCAAIISDTLMFRSPTCTFLDKAAAEALADIAGISIPEFASEMFRAGSNLKDKSPEEIFYQDFKKFIMGDVTFGVPARLHPSMRRAGIHQGTASAADGKRVRKTRHRDGILYADQYYRRIYRASVLWKRGKGSHRKSFEDLPVNEVSCELKGVVSRKKQLIPAFMMALQNQ